MKAKKITLLSLMCALIIALGFIPPFPVTFLPAPIILQNIGIMIAGLFLGRKGAGSVLLFLLLVAIGVPFLTGFKGGAAVFYGPTAGYLISYPIAAYLIGWGKEKLEVKDAPKWCYLALLLVNGVLLINLMGAVGMTVFANVPITASFIGSLVYLPGDLLKAGVVFWLFLSLPATVKSRINS